MFKGETDPLGLPRAAGGVGYLGGTSGQGGHPYRLVPPQWQFTHREQQWRTCLPALVMRADQGICAAALEQPLLLLWAEKVRHRNDHYACLCAGEIDQRPGQAVIQLQCQPGNACLLQALGQGGDLQPQLFVADPMIAAAQRRAVRITVGEVGYPVEQHHKALRCGQLNRDGMGASKESSKLPWARACRP